MSHRDGKATGAKLTKRLIKFLGHSSAKVHIVGDGKTALAERADARQLKLPILMINAALSDGVLIEMSARKAGELLEIGLSAEGKARLRSLQAEATLKGGSKAHTAGVGSSELVVNDGSPLARLYCTNRKTSGGWLSKEEFHAGERLRIDFEKSHVSPGLGVNWASFGMPRAPSRTGSTDDASEFADAARKRLSNALVVVGPEMADLLLDVCCFLKGLERVETERGWPRRSAKLLLKVALACLDRHYNPRPVQYSPKVRVWKDDAAAGSFSA